MDPRLLSAVKPSLKSLYAEIGSPERLESIVQEFYRRMAADAMLGFFFADRDLPTLARRQTDFLLKAMGASEDYAGRPPAQAHSALPPILPGHFDRRLRILEAVLAEAGISPTGAAAWIGFEEAFRDLLTQRTQSS